MIKDTYIMVQRDGLELIADGVIDLKEGDIFKFVENGIPNELWRGADTDPEKNKEGKWTIDAVIIPF